MQYIHHITRSLVMLSLLAFVLALGFSGVAMADDKAAEMKAAEEAPADGEKKADGDAAADGEKKADGDAAADGEKKADGDAPAAK